MARVDVGQLKTYPRAAVDYGQAKIDGLYARTRGVVPDALACFLLLVSSPCVFIDRQRRLECLVQAEDEDLNVVPAARDRRAGLPGRPGASLSPGEWSGRAAG
jgi:hypothetical protein